MRAELVSIIMPIYNGEKFLEQAIKSVKKQSYENWELICVDDGSTDNSMAILNKHKSNKIKIVKLSQNCGTNRARNKALDLAQGRYITYLDADDYYHREKLKKQVEFMQKNNYAITYTDYAIVYEDNKIKHVKVPKKLNYIEYMKNTMITTLGIMIDTNKIDKTNIYMENLALAEDTKTWLKILKTGKIVYALNEELGFYRQSKNSKSHNKIKAAKAVWNIYMNEEIPKIKAVYYFFCYAFNAIKKRI